jgi:hypothetical protein
MILELRENLNPMNHGSKTEEIKTPEWEGSMRFRFFGIILVCSLLLVSCGTIFPTAAPTANPADLEKQTKEAKKATEAAQPTATATPTPLPSMIVSILGNYLLNISPLDRSLGTKFEVTDAWYGPDANGNVIFRLKVNCDGLCSRERTFVVTMDALRTNLSMLDAMLPDNIVEMQLQTLNNYQPSGLVIVSWKDTVDYCYGTITDTQLAGRIVRP